MLNNKWLIAVVIIVVLVLAAWWMGLFGAPADVQGTQQSAAAVQANANVSDTALAEAAQSIDKYFKLSASQLSDAAKKTTAASIVTVAGSLQSTMDAMRTLGTKIQTRLSNAHLSTEKGTAAVKILNDLYAQILNAGSETTAATSNVSTGKTPNAATLKKALQNLVNAVAYLQAALADIQGALNMLASVSATPVSQ